MGAQARSGGGAGDALKVVHPDIAVARLAARQRGVVSYAQLLACGLSPREIARRVATGRLHRLHRGVYAVGHTSLPPLGRETAALLALGDRAVLSHRSAAVLWGLLPPADGAVDVLLLDARRASRPGIAVHTTMALPARDVRRRQDLPVTSPARSVLDLAGSPELEPALSQALLRRLVRTDELLERGGRAIKALLEGGATPTRSEAERRLLALVKRARLPRPETNVRVGRWEVDALWRAQRVVVEIDGYAFHADRAQFEQDRLRDAELQAAGHRVVRLTWRQLTEEPEAVAARLAVTLAV